MSTVTCKNKRNESDEKRLMMIAASFGAATQSPASAVLAASLFSMQNEFDGEAELVQPVRGPGFWSQLAEFFSEYRRYRRLARKAGQDLEIPYYRAQDIEDEVQRHRWIEAEKAGRDIWIEKDPRDPEGVALRDWLSRHFDRWKNERLNRRQQIA